MRIVGAHPVASKHLWSVARVRGVSATVLAVLMGLWILQYQDALFRTPAWAPLFHLVNGHISWLGWSILIGGFFGILGLFTRYQILSIISCIICISWFGAISAFLWYSNLTDAPNIGSILCLYGFLEYAYRFILLAVPLEPGEEYGAGW